MSVKKSEAPPSLPVVAVCASAGGLAAYKAFFSGLPPGANLGMAFVLVQHLDPAHKSLLAELIRGFSTLAVFEVTEGLAVQANCIYIIPRAQEMTIVGGVLHLVAQKTDAGLRLPINVFLESLARDQGGLAAAVILSGTGTDGTAGSLAIRRGGGFVLAQSQETSEFSGMPSSVAATGEVNAVLAPQDMIGALRSHFSLKAKPRKPSIDELPLADPETMDRILLRLKSMTSHDFSQYKPASIRRRVERRMVVHSLTKLADYDAVLEREPQEVLELFNDLLIGVTSFFRDAAVFEALAQRVLPQLVSQQAAGSKIRVWSAGCSTGEEAYSLAMLLRESLESLALDRSIEVFASDLDERAVSVARSGVYPASAFNTMALERLQKFFTPVADQKFFKVAKTIRNLVVFSEHDLLKDPPFMNIDLLVCRNVLIYFSLELQKKLLRLFFYALKPGGILVLGTSESIGDFDHLFQALDRDAKVYVRRDRSTDPPRHRSQPFHFAHGGLSRPTLPVNLAQSNHPAASLREITESALLGIPDLAAALVGEQGEVHYLHGKTGYFLEPAVGVSAPQNILTLAKPGLKQTIATALRRARATGSAVYQRETTVTWKSMDTAVQVSVHPLKSTYLGADQPLFLVLLEERPARKVSGNAALPEGERVEELKEELKIKEDYLKSAIDDMESSNQELRSSNEELQSVNEELQSTNEELDTSKEELYSVNEELSTVNSELSSKLSLLSTTLNDMNNLLAATGVATVFVDLNMKILRFTPEATRIINLVAADVGRSVGHITSNLVNYQSLEQDTQAVLDSLVRFEVEIQSKQDYWYRLRIQPYRTLDNIIEGAVISFADITELVHHREKLQANNDLLRLGSFVKDSQDAVVVQDLAGKLLAWNPAAAALYGWTEEEALTMNRRDHIPDGVRDEELKRLKALVNAEFLEPYTTLRLTKLGPVVEVFVTSSPLVTKAKKVYAISTVERAKRKQSVV